MELTERNINLLFNNYISFIDLLSDKNKYNNNIKHLLYIIIPAFIAKYSPTKEPLILNCFSNVRIIIKEHEKNISASFGRLLRKDKEEYITDKYITISPFSDSSLTDILDTIIHEFNHAINSFNNEIKEDGDYVRLRTGLCYLNYKKSDLSFVNKSKETILEELLNTNQTEEIINIIKSFGDFDIENTEIANTVHNVCSELKNKDFVSNAYRFQKDICSSLMNNKTFIPTVYNLRLKGTIEDIPTLFNDVIGNNNAYKLLNDLLTEMYEEILKYEKNKLLKNKHLNKIKSLAGDITKLIQEYDLKCVFR